MRKAALILLSVASSFMAPAQDITPRKKLNIDEGWKFHLGNASEPAKDFNYSIANVFAKSGYAGETAIDSHFNDTAWRTVDLPHDWAVELPFVNVANSDVESHGYKPVGGLFPATSIGWYRKHFRISPADSGKRFQIQLDGIFRNATIWLNNFYVGNNLSGYIGCSFDVTDMINFRGDNVLVVRVDASQYEGWFYEGAGIYRHAWLNEYDDIHVEDGGLFVYALVKNGVADITIETSVANKGHASAICDVHSYITDRDGKVIAQTKDQTLSLAMNGENKAKQHVLLRAPRLWSTEDPYLYRAISVVKVGSRATDQQQARFGIRSLRFDANDGFFLNGKHLKIQGMCNHQDHAGVGSALPDYLQYFRVRLLKTMGVNACRTSHNPPTPEFLDACDSLGMLVLDENRLLNSSPEYTAQFEKMVVRDRNHPSVFLWSIGNEEWAIQTTTYGKRIAQSLIAKQKELDPSRTCTYASDAGSEYRGVNEVIPIRGFNYRHFAVAGYHRAHPMQPILGSEMGSTVTTRGIYQKDTVRAYVPDQDITAPPWASTAEAWWKVASENKYWIGGFVWTGFDYRGEPTPYQWPNINSHFGIMDMCGFPKNIFYYYQSWWSDKDVLHISPHWNWSQSGMPIDVWVNSNADNVELFLNGKSLGKKDMIRDSHLRWSVAYEPGVLEAVGYKNGKRIETKVETAGEAAVVVVSPSKTTLIADGRDVAVLNISVVDRQNHPVPDANDLIEFSVTGDAKIIGVGNGDPSSHEADKIFDGAWKRQLFNGHCQVILQAGTKNSMIHFEARSGKLQAGATDIHTIQPGLPHRVIPINAAAIHVAELKRPVDKMLGADISFLPELEDRGITYSDNGVQKDAIEILRDHGLNYVRLRLFVNPENDSGYSPKKGFCDLAHTVAMAKRVKAAGLKFLLDFHYSDTWADPQKQFKPAAWKGLNFEQLKQAVFSYSQHAIRTLKAEGASPDMVQIGNEINHGMIWPEGHVNNLDSLADLVYAGIEGVRSIDPGIAIMLHIALGGQNDEARFFLDNMIVRGVPFDVIGLSYYPRWHGTLEDLRYNLDDLARHYNKDVIVVEYSHLKSEVNELAFNVYGGHGKGSAIWEPLNTWEAFFDKNGKSNATLQLYDELSKKYLGNAR